MVMLRAQAPGSCTICHASIELDEWITNETDDESWVHESCLLQPLPFDAWQPDESAAPTDPGTTAPMSADSPSSTSSPTAAMPAGSSGDRRWERMVRLGHDRGVLVTIEGQLLQLVLVDPQLELPAMQADYYAGGELLDTIAAALRELVEGMRS